MKEKSIAEIRPFNRFYTTIIGLMDQHILNSRYSLPEVRILYDHCVNATASDIMASLNIDKGYLSRIFILLNEASNKQLRKILEGLTEAECDKLVRHMSAIKSILSTARRNNN
jgi:hypothetical protein